MSFFDNLKNKMGVGGVRIELDAPSHAKKSDGFISGTLTMTTESEQYVKSISVKLVERSTTISRGKERRTSINTSTEIRGEYKISESFVITAGDIKEFGFVLHFRAGIEWQDLSGVEIEIKGMKIDLFKSVGTLGLMMSNKTLDYSIEVVANVEGVWRSPVKSQRITVLP